MPEKREWYSINAKGDDAEIYIYDVIGEDWLGGISAKQFVDDLNGITAESITVKINSPGGDVFDGTAIYNALVQHDAKITTQIDGMALSMASVVAMAGDVIKMAENAMFMIHNPWTIALGDAGEMRRTADVLDKTKLNLLSAYTKQSHLSNDEISALMDEETWLTGPEALDNGFVDEVTSAVKLAANWNKNVFKNFKHVPDNIIEIADAKNVPVVENVDAPRSRKLAIERMRLDTYV